MNLVVCIPGRQFSNKFLRCWTEFIGYCNRSGISLIFSNEYNPNVYYARSQCLGADTRRGKYQKPFDGKLDYDYILWIDSDIIFNYKDFLKLIERNVDVCGGLYLMENGIQYAAVKNWDLQFFKQHGTFQFLSPEDIKNTTDIIEISYTGFGFLLMKKGVIEKLEYPWFEPQIINFGEEMIDFASEDVSFCLKVKSAGIKIYIDPTVKVGHEKVKILI
jgi:GT2 family glycosyltransferase